MAVLNKGTVIVGSTSPLVDTRIPCSFGLIARSEQKISASPFSFLNLLCRAIAFAKYAAGKRAAVASRAFHYRSRLVTQSRMELTYVIWARDKLVSHCVTIRAATRERACGSSPRDSYFHVKQASKTSYRDRGRGGCSRINHNFLNESGIESFYIAGRIIDFFIVDFKCLGRVSV